MNISDYVFINKKVLNFVGLYPTNIVRYIMCCVCMFTIIVPQALQIYRNWRDLAIVLETRYISIIFSSLIRIEWIYKFHAI